MEATGSSEMVTTYKPAWYHNSEDQNLNKSTSLQKYMHESGAERCEIQLKEM
jgi:hypothetical protein